MTELVFPRIHSTNASSPPTAKAIERSAAPNENRAKFVLPPLGTLLEDERTCVGPYSDPISDSSVPKHVMPPSLKHFRRVCSEVVPGQVFVSGSTIAGDWRELEFRGITHVINVASRVCRCPFVEKIKYLAIGLEDSCEVDIQSYFYECINFIEQALARSGRVLIHCVEGVSRSCTVTIAYLMWKRSLGYEQADVVVRTARPVCEPNLGFVFQLLQFQTRLEQPGVTAAPITWRLSVSQSGEHAPMLIAVKVTDPTRDPRFVYISQSQVEFSILVGPEVELADRARELAFETVERITKTERFESRFVKYVEEDGTEFASKTELDAEAAAFANLCELSAQVYLVDGLMHALEKPIPNFTQESMQSHCVYLFVLPAAAFVWIGTEASVENETAMETQFVRLLPEAIDSISFVQQGAETEAFWTLFSSH